MLFLLGLVTLFFVIPRYGGGGALDGDLAPAFMPYVATVLGTGAMALLLLARLVGAGGADSEPAPLPARSWTFIGTAAAVLAAAFVLMSYIGYVAGAAALAVGFMALARTSVRAALIATVALPAALWLLLERVLGFPLP